MCKFVASVSLILWDRSMIVVVEDMLEEVVPQVVKKVDHLISSSMTMASWTCTVRGKEAVAGWQIRPWNTSFPQS